MSVTGRVGILYRSRGIIRSIRIREGEEIAESLLLLDRVDDVEEWMKKANEGGGAKEDKGEEDRSYLDYFYRCLDEGVEFYYLYEPAVGWKCGCTMRDLPICGRLIEMEEWLRWKNLEV